jgi:hypothetical protein
VGRSCERPFLFGGRAVGFVQSNSGVFTGLASPSLAFLSNVVAGDVILLFFNTSSSGSPIPSDSLGNSYTELSLGGYFPNPGQFAAFGAVSASSGPNTVTASSGPGNGSMAILEYNGVKASPFDGVTFNNGTSNNQTTGTIPVSGVADIVVAAFGLLAGTTQTPGGSFNERATSGNANSQIFVEDLAGVSSGLSATTSTPGSVPFAAIGISLFTVAPQRLQTYAPEIYEGPPLRGAPWLSRLPKVPPISPPPPAPQNTSLLKYASEVHTGPPMPGAPWLPEPPIIQPISTQAPPQFAFVPPQLYAPEIHFGPAMPGAPWLASVVPSIPVVNNILGPVSPPSPVSKLPGNVRPFVPRVPGPPRLQRFTQLVSNVINSAINAGTLQQTSANTYQQIGGGFQGSGPPTVNTDITVGATPGCSYVDITAGQIYICINNSQGSAQWLGPLSE